VLVFSSERAMAMGSGGSRGWAGWATAHPKIQPKSEEPLYFSVKKSDLSPSTIIKVQS
jgi:hypothetical protein